MAAVNIPIFPIFYFLFFPYFSASVAFTPLQPSVRIPKNPKLTESRRNSSDLPRKSTRIFGNLRRTPSKSTRKQQIQRQNMAFHFKKKKKKKKPENLDAFSRIFANRPKTDRTFENFRESLAAKRIEPSRNFEILRESRQNPLNDRQES